MRTLVEGLIEALRLIADTFRLWWRNLLPLVTWYLAGYLGFRLSIMVSIWLGRHQHRSLAIGLFSAGVLLQMVVLVAMIRMLANSLYRWRDATTVEGSETVDPTQQRLLELLSITLLPIVAVYSAWGFLDKQIKTLGIEFTAVNGAGTDFILQVNKGTWKDFLPAIVILLVVRRVIEAIDGRWPSRPAKFLQVWSEAFFALLTLVITPVVADKVKTWFHDRRFWLGLSDHWAAAKDWFAGIHIPVPAGIEWLWGIFWNTLWPLFKDGIGEPLTWLAITTVVFGHQALSAGALLKGTRLERTLSAQSPQTQVGRVAAVAGRAPDLVLGGLKEKFYPTLNAFRLLVRVGPVYLGVVCLVYTIYTLAANWSYVWVQRLIGDPGPIFNASAGNLADLVTNTIYETLRIALLAAAFDQCISVGRTAQVESAATEPTPVKP
jgi:hypothetical protein